ncbi:MAG: DUF2971 domain-containing protein [Butyrivibrio sp.]|nr:DUF2971 domain-containing protein [Acetatifactor muris]MCM1558283.1 DUF2971 domain-containing protein [Butyrivibrio sp.]
MKKKIKEYSDIVEAKKNEPYFEKTEKGFSEIPLVYQYRNFQSFWQILQSDALWATNARFSNDEAEQKFGMELIASVMPENMKIDIDNLGLDENYIICFCLEDDKLSQWRGYAAEGGVSMGFDFGMPRAFSILHSEAKDISVASNCDIQYVGLNNVCYVRPKQKAEDEEEYRLRCRKQINLCHRAIKDDEIAFHTDEIQKKAPFIKHEGFNEENEYRLVFSNKKGDLNACVRYRDTHEAQLRYPYIVVKAALPDDKVVSCVVRVCVDNENKEKKLVQELENTLKKEIPTLVQGCHLYESSAPDAEEPFCTGCVLRHWESAYSYQRCRYNYGNEKEEYTYCLREGASCVVISQGKDQKRIYEIVHKRIQELLKDTNFTKGQALEIPVWCEGHLPLRRITVGPCQNQNGMLEAIRHYCKHTYWLQDVEVQASTIPFRKSL